MALWWTRHEAFWRPSKESIGIRFEVGFCLFTERFFSVQQEKNRSEGQAGELIGQRIEVVFFCSRDDFFLFKGLPVTGNTVCGPLVDQT